MKKNVYKIEDYRGISADVWTVFKNYFPEDADTSSFVKDVHALDEKYKKDERQYRFMQKLLKVYFDELNELKGFENGGNKENQ